MSSIEGVVTNIQRLLEKKQPILIAIDGYGGAGKTTLANRIKAEFPVSSVIALDDFATDTTSGADRERFIAHVLEPLSNGKPAKYQPYNWKRRSLADWVDVAPEGVILIEGVSVLGKDFNSYYGLRIWIDCSFETGRERMKERERRLGRVFSLSKFFNVWEKDDRDYGLTEPWSRADIIVPLTFE